MIWTLLLYKAKDTMMLKTLLLTLFKYKEKILYVVIAVAILATAMYVSHLRKEITHLKQVNTYLNSYITAKDVSIENLNVELRAKDNLIDNLNASLNSCHLLTIERAEDQQKIDNIMNTQSSNQNAAPSQPTVKVNQDVYTQGIDFINAQFDFID